MKQKHIQIINEVIAEFDFLGNDKYLKEQDNVSLLNNEDFQKQFICDVLTNSKKIKTNKIINIIC